MPNGATGGPATSSAHARSCPMNAVYELLFDNQGGIGRVMLLFGCPQDLATPDAQ